MLQRVETDPALAPSRVVPQSTRDKAVRRFVKRYGEDDRQNPGGRVPQHACLVRRGVHAISGLAFAPPAISSAKRRAAARASNSLRRPRRSVLARAMRVCASIYTLWAADTLPV